MVGALGRWRFLWRFSHWRLSACSIYRFRAPHGRRRRELRRRVQAANPAQDDESMLLRFQFRESSALLAGDAHKRTESLLEGENPRADLLKIGHHAARPPVHPTSCRWLRRSSRWYRWVLQQVPPPAAQCHEALP
jgi:hypothetical protein